jgi:hypothetical protein
VTRVCDGDARKKEGQLPCSSDRSVLIVLYPALRIVGNCRGHSLIFIDVREDLNAKSNISIRWASVGRDWLLA